MISMMATIISYKFGQVSQQEVEAMLDIKFEETRVYRDIRETALKDGLQEGRKEGRKEGAVNMAVQLLNAKFGELDESVQASISNCSLPTLEALVKAALTLSSMDELRVWLNDHANKEHASEEQSHA